MKKLLFTSILLATVFVVLGGMGAFKKMEGINFASKTHPKEKASPVYTVKYDDCIKKGDYLKYTVERGDSIVDWDIEKMNESIKKYRNSLESTLKNLNTVDAHDFIHKAFEKAENTVSEKNISKIQQHYHYQIMRLCYESDKYLNQNTVGIL